ncbi:hypothetical protein BRDCF_p218 [Bacteroidales bacterium CF]|nr:hypothetical protein BRDCF_p218 [Bacteroidales bacterium CF]
MGGFFCSAAAFYIGDIPSQGSPSSLIPFAPAENCPDPVYLN